MKRLVIDFRCPACNQPLMGKEEVAIRVKRPVFIDKCPNCKTKVVIVKSGRRELTNYHYSKA